MILSALIQAAAASQQDGDFFFPAQSSTNAGTVDAIYYFIFWTSAAAFALIVGATIYFALKYRRTKVGINPEDSPHHSTSIEIVWSVIPTIFMVVMFKWGFEDFVDRRTPPADAYTVNVKAMKWAWNYSYQEGAETNGGWLGGPGDGLVVPVNTPIRLKISSMDVLHSFFVPAFRIKMDAVPGRYTYAWFEATEVGDYPVFCTEYCGTRHSRMLSMVKVVTQEEFDAWMATQTDLGSLPPLEAGRKLYERKCISCHMVDGSKLVGPPLNGLYGQQESLADGSSVLVDDNYLRESILEPAAKIVAGYDNAMPSFAGQLSEEELDWLILYIESIK
jgi:cytochrome c oxidase subunit 2